MYKNYMIHNHNILERIIFKICHLQHNENYKEPRNKSIEDALRNCLFSRPFPLVSGKTAPNIYSHYSGIEVTWAVINHFFRTFANNDTLSFYSCWLEFQQENSETFGASPILPLSLSGFSFLSSLIRLKCTALLFSYTKINGKKILKQEMNVNWENLAKSQNNSWCFQRQKKALKQTHSLCRRVKVDNLWN